MSRELRKIIRIDEKKCNGCGLCATACHEGAIDIVDGKAKLVREHFCDGLGDCLPSCPAGAISFEEREAEAYDEAAVKESQLKKGETAMKHTNHSHHSGGCPGSRVAAIRAEAQDNLPSAPAKAVSRLQQWPVQIKLVPVNAPFFDGAKLLIAADCTAYAYGNFHEEFMKGKVTLIGCPEAGCCGLHGKADANHSKQQYSVCNHSPDGGSLLRRDPECGAKGIAGER